LAAAADVDKGWLSRILNGHEKPSRDFIEKVGAALQLPSDYFVEVRRAFILDVLEASPEATNEVFSLTRHITTVKPPAKPMNEEATPED
jgi:transcriptional regulator with XRE-family HTH domain